MKIKVADVVFEINNKYDYCEKFMTDYLTDEKAELTIEFDKGFLVERTKKNAASFHVGYTEYLEIYRSICNYIAAKDGFMMHGAVIKYLDNAYLFTAPSGIGKTTHIKLWQQLYGDHVQIINGDKPIIRYINGEYIVYGTPWCGKEHYNVNTKAPLKGIVLLNRGDINSIRPVMPEDVGTFLLKQIFVPKNPQLAIKSLDFAEKMFHSVPLYQLHCNISSDAAKTACEGIYKN